jgi:hypothetical protein
VEDQKEFMSEIPTAVGISLNSFPEPDISIRPHHSQPVSFLVRFLLIQKMDFSLQQENTR